MSFPDLEAPIVPGRSLGGVEIGALASEAWGETRDLNSSSPAQPSRVEMGPIVVWLSKGFVHQVGAREGYRGSVLGTGIGLGSSLADVERELGRVVEDDEDNLVVEGWGGLLLETEAWSGDSLRTNLQARISQIMVIPG
jgi:hypothetical protein